MTCPHLEETSALFDGRDVDRTHADSCEECRAFLADAATLRESVREVTFEVRRPGFRFPYLVPAAVVLALVLFLILRPERTREDGPFAGLDGGGRAVITVKDTR